MAIAARTNARQGSRRLAAVARSRRCEAIARRNAAEDAEQWFKDMSGAACGARLRASAAGGCGPHGSRSRTTATTANRSQTPRQTGVVNWRQRRSEIGIVFRQAGKTRIANTGFSRASRSSALRRLAKLAPPASAREHLCHPSTASDKKPVPVSLPNQNHKLAAARATLRIAKPQNDKKRRSNNRPQTTIPYQSSCAITPPADC